MIGSRHFLFFIAWIGCLCGAYVATMSLPEEFLFLPSFIAWCIYLLFTVSFLALAILGAQPSRRKYIGASVFGISALALMYLADINVDDTPGYLIVELITSESEDRAPWLHQAEHVAHIIDLGVASCMTFFGALFGTYFPNDAIGDD